MTNGSTALIDGKWGNEGLYTDFEPHSTAFRIRLQPSKEQIKRRNEVSSPLLHGLNQAEARYTWRGGNLCSEGIFGLSTTYYPTKGLPRIAKKKSKTPVRVTNKLAPGSRWHGTINYYDKKRRFTQNPTYELVKGKGASLWIMGEKRGRLLIDGNHYELSLNINGKKVKATLIKERAPIVGANLLQDGAWSGTQSGSRLTLRRRVKVPPKNRSKAETITLRFEDPNKKRR